MRMIQNPIIEFDVNKWGIGPLSPIHEGVVLRWLVNYEKSEKEAIGV